MAWVLRLVETGPEGQAGSLDVLEIRRPDTLHDVADFGAIVQPFLDVRTAVLNDTLEAAFRHRHPGFRPANDDHRLTAAA